MNEPVDQVRALTHSGEEAKAEDSPLLRRLRDRTFRTPDGKAFIAIDSDRGRKIVPIQSRPCRLWIGFKLEEESGKQPSQAELRSICDRLEVYASDAPVADVHVRVALAGGRVFMIWPIIAGASSRLGRMAGTSSTRRRCTLFARQVCGRCLSLKGVGPSRTFGR
jgi:hypothetical protein